MKRNLRTGARPVEAGVTIPGLRQGDPERIVVEAYPGALARQLISRTSYKNDSRRKQTELQRETRHRMLALILDGELERSHFDTSRGSAQSGRRPQRRSARCAFLRDPDGLGVDDAKRAIRRAGTSRSARGWIAVPSLREIQEPAGPASA
ncbi:hypothetical protein EJ066_17345 [Mesorhizobium sp. M9A.F.Ca.ET.002.03.1.2]|uniref:hypothetical protein n=1 Tax=Mesorhizobium sp. M9A.F.Ca.ET.002.03.1.2 TaxID=2493668 RepID=UPI000F7617E0|nr:hypothetical protein [Mesorhizobium sp. M9A.F.Ca.ET.002.03.1.2]AZN98780.1 hypothetical protein EJ066_17345 [Mesorhizobium sp. M9A.F.Ca.ET.002.03.1.2]